jgi:hypothetical protein
MGMYQDDFGRNGAALFLGSRFDEFVKGRKLLKFVVPAKTGETLQEAFYESTRFGRITEEDNFQLDTILKTCVHLRPDSLFFFPRSQFRIPQLFEMGYNGKNHRAAPGGGIRD